MQHPELGRRILDRVAETVAHVGKVEIMPKQDGRNMTMVLGPDKRAQAAHRKAQEAAANGVEPDGSGPDSAEPASNGEATPAPSPAETAT